MNTSMHEQFPADVVDRVVYTLVFTAGLLSCLEAHLIGGRWGAAASLGLVAMLWAVRCWFESLRRPLFRS